MTRERPNSATRTIKKNVRGRERDAGEIRGRT